jgi:hypothetical protein
MLPAAYSHFNTPVSICPLSQMACRPDAGTEGGPQIRKELGALAFIFRVTVVPIPSSEWVCPVRYLKRSKCFQIFIAWSLLPDLRLRTARSITLRQFHCGTLDEGACSSERGHADSLLGQSDSTLG